MLLWFSCGSTALVWTTGTEGGVSSKLSRYPTANPVPYNETRSQNRLCISNSDHSHRFRTNLPPGQGGASGNESEGLRSKNTRPILSKLPGKRVYGS